MIYVRFPPEGPKSEVVLSQRIYFHLNFDVQSVPIPSLGAMGSKSQVSPKQYLHAESTLKAIEQEKFRYRRMVRLHSGFHCIGYWSFTTSGKWYNRLRAFESHTSYSI